MSTKDDALTAEYVREALTYNECTGAFTWRTRPLDHFKTTRTWNAWNARLAGTQAGYSSPLGYLVITINNRAYAAQNLAWLWMTGEWPINLIDHRDTDGFNNIWKNLREATHSENQCNRRVPSNNKSGFKGVSWKKDLGKWQVQIKAGAINRFLGHFDEDKLDEAAAAYAKAAQELHGEFARVK